MDLIRQAKDLIENKEYEPATEILLPLAAQNNAEAQYLMGYLYLTTADVTRAESKEWLRKAAKQDHPAASYHLAMLSCTECECTCPPKDEASWQLLHKAAQLGCADAQRDLGYCYARDDLGLAKDDEKARYWYTQAAAQGHSEAQYDLGLMWLNGECGAANFEQGYYWLTQSAAQDDRPMCRYSTRVLAKIFEEGLYGQQPDAVAAEKWRQREQWLDEH